MKTRSATMSALCITGLYAALGSAGSALAHDGHGLSGTHWHASDTLGFLVVIGLAAVAVWMSRGGK